MKWWQTGQTGVSNSVFSTGSLHDAWQGKAARPIWILRAKSIMARIVKLSDKKPDIRKQLHLKIITNFACKTGGVHIRWKTFSRQKQAKKRSLCVINEHFEPVFNTVAATQIVFRLVKRDYSVLMCARWIRKKLFLAFFLIEIKRFIRFESMSQILNLHPDIRKFSQSFETAGIFLEIPFVTRFVKQFE